MTTKSKAKIKSKRRVGRPSLSLPSESRRSRVQQLAAKIRELRAGRKVSTLASAAGMSHQNWYLYEQAKISKAPAIETLWAIEKSLGAEPNVLAAIVYPQIARPYVVDES